MRNDTFFGVAINTHEHRHTNEHNILNYDSRFHSSRLSDAGRRVLISRKCIENAEHVG